MALTRKDKSMIDLLFPTLVAGMVGYFTFKKSKDWRFILVAIGAAFLVAYIVSSQITKRLYEAGPPPVPIGGGCDNFDARSITDTLYQDITSSWFTPRNRDVYNTLLGASDCQLRSIYNYWNNNYYGKTKSTLPVAIAGESAFWDSDFGALQEAVKAKFSTLQLT